MNLDLKVRLYITDTSLIIISRSLFKKGTPPIEIPFSDLQSRKFNPVLVISTPAKAPLIWFTIGIVAAGKLNSLSKGQFTYECA